MSFPVAVCTVLRLPREAEIAQALDPRRPIHGRETGFAHFADDLRHEIGPLVRPHSA